MKLCSSQPEDSGFRRGVVMPLPQVELDALLTNDVDESIQVQRGEIQDDRMFYDIWTSGVFHTNQ